MNDINPDKDTREPINIKNAHVVERKPGMNLEDLITKVREKTQSVLAEKAKESNRSTN